MENKQYVNTAELADRFRTSPAQIYDWAREHKFPQRCVLRIGKKLLFDIEAINKWAAEGGSMSKGVNELDG
jgi:predicted DNA-binding transcriptional regulator AlpA